MAITLFDNSSLFWRYAVFQKINAKAFYDYSDSHKIYNTMILHIPHSKHVVPEGYRELFVLSDIALQKELLLLVDWYTDELFDGFDAVTFQYPRLLVDVERFPEDEDEPMSKVGMGMIYTRTSDGERLKRDLTVQEISVLISLYDSHHQALNDAVGHELETYGQAMLVDCHSFPSEPLRCDLNQKRPRPDFCIGTDAFHTPKDLADSLILKVQEWGYTVVENEPYEGTLVPSDYYQSNTNVRSIMIEVNRALYMDEHSGLKLESFSIIQLLIQELLFVIHQYSDRRLCR